MATSPARFKYSSEGSGYVVRDTTRPIPGYVGIIEKYERRYIVNLRRMFVVRGWIARPERSARPLGKTDTYGDPTVYRTRDEAAQALAAALAQIGRGPAAN